MKQMGTMVLLATILTGAVTFFIPLKLHYESVLAYSPKTIPEMIETYAKQYRVNPKHIARVINCESSGIDVNEQSMIRYSFSDAKRGIKRGEQEKSFGIAQIHLPDHPDITLEQAQNHEFSIEYMAKEFSKGNQNMWTCYRKIYKV